MKNKISTSWGFVIILTLSLTIAVFAWECSRLDTISIPSAWNKEAENKYYRLDKSTWKKYINKEFNFSFEYPDTFSEEKFSNNDVERKYLSGPTSLMTLGNGYLSISIAPAVDVHGKEITTIKDFLNTYPSVRRQEATSSVESKIGDTVTIEDSWKVEELKGNQKIAYTRKVIYALHHGIVYEINFKDDPYSDPRREALEILSSLNFTNPEEFIEINSATEKYTVYRNNFHKFQITLPVGWHLPSPNNKNDQLNFRTDRNCYIYGGWQRICDGFSLQIYPTEETSTEALARLKESELDPMIVDNFVAGAVTISAKPAVPFMGGKDSRVYYLYFDQEKRYITAGSENKEFVPIFKTIKLLK